MTRRATARQADIERAVKAMLSAGLRPAVRVLPDRSVAVIPINEVDAAIATSANLPPITDEDAAAWDEATK